MLNWSKKAHKDLELSKCRFKFIQISVLCNKVGLHIIILFRFCSLIREMLKKVMLDANDLLNNMKLKTPFLSFLSNYQAYAYALHSIVTKEHVE